ncbi:VWA domain-containing protein [Pseudonocardia phyllosphaerae]|uniref:VWA domain-containing protein n=1 Tax=Pseudonocardia phyllosphaerae TaxID=3390502 RepID=UPI00397A9117
MNFVSPWWLLALVVVAALAVGYVWLLRRRRSDVLRFTNLELLETVMPKRPGRWRHVPVIALLTALALLTVALAGPQAMAKVPRNRATVLLVIDVSLSMKATDVAPTRLAAAQAAAKQFADQLTPGVNLGLVSFAGTAAVLVSPTTDRNAVKSGVDGLQLAESTATGEAIFTAMQSIDSFSRTLSGGPDQSGQPPPARIVLLSDGTQTVPGPEGETEPRGSFTAAQEAAKRGVPVSTISFGTTYGTIDLDGGRTPVAVDDASMQRIAQLSGGRFFTAASESELRAVYSDLSEELGYEEREVDASRPWMIAGFLLLVAGLIAGILLGRRVP